MLSLTSRRVVPPISWVPFVADGQLDIQASDDMFNAGPSLPDKIGRFSSRFPGDALLHSAPIAFLKVTSIWGDFNARAGRKLYTETQTHGGLPQVCKYGETFTHVQTIRHTRRLKRTDGISQVCIHIRRLSRTCNYQRRLKRKGGYMSMTSYRETLTHVCTCMNRHQRKTRTQNLFEMVHTFFAKRVSLLFAY